MKFSKDKYKILHLGRKNEMHNYKMRNKWLGGSSAKKGRWVTEDLKFNINQQCDAVVKKANIILGYINRSVICKTWYVIIPLYLALVRPQLEYCVHFWAPHFSKDVDKLERVQRTATKMIKKNLEDLTYVER